MLPHQKYVRLLKIPSGIHYQINRDLYEKEFQKLEDSSQQCTNLNLPGCSSAPQMQLNDTNSSSTIVTTVESNFQSNILAIKLPGINLNAQNISNITINVYFYISKK